jgi:formiminotetrahydrofolate cyclodeaminase
VPLTIAETAADVAGLAALAAREGADHVRADAWAAATLAEASSAAAARLVHVNLATRPDDELSTRADLAARAAAAARPAALEAA